MNGYMNIRIQVLANQARKQIQEVSGDITRLAAAQAAANTSASKFSGGMTKSLKSLSSMGNRLQWTGRQLLYNFTLPILAAGAAGASFAMANERAMTRVEKVYDKAGMTTKEYNAEIAALTNGFEKLSEKYGIAQDETIGIAAEWAAAGSSGLALAKQTDLTMKTMVLGELKAAEATEALIAIQAQYNQSSDELADTVARLNNVENQTGTTMGDLITSFSRAAGVARGAGVDVAHLAAMTAALTPAAGSAAQAGNALKTIISRLLSPTAEASQILNELGIHVSEAAWKSANASTRIQLLSDKYAGLSDSQKAVVSATLASRYQINKFEVLMDAIARKGNEAGEGMSYYWKALEAATNRTQYLDQVTSELNTVLDSNPKKWDKIKVMMQNTLADAVQPMLPALLYLGQMFANLFRSIADMSPVTQKWVGALLLTLIVLPMVMRYMGALTTLFAAFGYVVLYGAIKPIMLLSGAFVGLIKMLKIFTVVTTVAKLAWDVLMLGFGLFSAVLPIVMVAFNGIVAAILGSIGPLRAAVMGIWAAMRASWLIGLTGLIPMTLAGFAMIGAAIPTTFIGAISGAWGIVVAVWEVAMASLGVITLSLGTTLPKIWTMISISMSVVMAQTGRGLAIIWSSLMAALEAILIGFATAAGIIWRAIPLTMAAGLRGPWSVILALTSALMVGMQAIFTYGWVAIQHIIVAGAALAGILWRGAMVGIATIVAAGTAFITRLWAARMALWSAMVWTWGTVIVPMFTQIMKLIMAALASPWTWVVLAVVAVLYGLRDKIKVAWTSIIDWLSGAMDAIVNRVVGAFNMLPEGIRNALAAVVRMIRAVALKVYEWFSYLNPFAHHSPSLVENVTKGMAEVGRQFGTLTQIKGPIDSAYASIARFKQAMGALGANLEFADVRLDIAEVNPSALGSFDSLVNTLVATRARADQLQAAVKNQEAVVDAWKGKLDAANDALDAQKERLQALQDVADGYADQISKLNGEIDTLARTPLTGMGAMEDALFANEMAQKRLRLEMLKAGEQGGQSVDDIRSKIASLAGEMEKITGAREDLRSMGAGSEILSHYDAQLDALAEQKKALEHATAPVNEMQKQLDELQRQAEIMDLEKSLKFDPLTRQIENAANAMDEMPFEAIIGKIHANQAAVDQLERSHASATAAVQAQEAAVASAQAAVDSIQASYDAESKKLEALRDLYQEVADAVRDMEGALSDAGGAARAMKDAKEASEGYVSPALQNFRDAAGGDFADVGGSGMLGREGGAGGQAAEIDDWITKNVGDAAGDAFGKIDMFGPLKDMWKMFVKWWKKTIQPWIDATGEFFTHMFDGVDIFSGLRGKGDEIGGFFSTMWDSIVAVATSVWDLGKLLWDIMGPDVKETLDLIWGFFVDFWDACKEIWVDIKDLWDPFVEATKNAWNLIKVPIGLIFAYIVAGVQTAWSVLNGVLGPVLDWIVGLFKNLWTIVKGVIEIFIGLFTLDWKTFFLGLGHALGGLGKLLWDTIVSLGDVLWGAVTGLASGLYDGFVWIASMIWEGLESGLRAVGLGWLVDIFGAIIGWVEDLFGIHSPSTVFAEIGGNIIQGLWNGLTAAVGAIWDFFYNLPMTILGWMGDAAVWLYEKGKAALGGLLSGIVDKAPDVAAWLLSLPGMILGWIGDAGTWLLQKGKDILVGLFTGVESKGEDLAAWFIALPGKIKDWVGDATQWLIEKGKDIIKGLKDGIEEKIEDVVTWFTELPDKVKTWVTDAVSWLKQHGKDIITGLINGIVEKGQEIATWFQELPGKIGGWIGDAGTWLKDEGPKMIEGFIKGAIEHAPQVAKIIGIVILVILGAIVAIPLLLLTAGVALIVGLVMGIGQAIGDWLGPKLEELKQFFSDKWQEIKEAVSKKWDELWDNVKQIWTDTGEWIKQKFSDFKQKISDTWQSIKDSVGEKWNSLWENVKGIWNGVGEWIRLKFEEFKQKLTDVWQSIKDGVMGKWNGLVDGVKGAAQTVVDWVTQKFNWLKDTVTGIFQNIKDGVGNVWDQVIDKVKSPIRVVFNWVNSNMIDPVNSLLAKLPGDLKIGHLPALREGGQVSGPGTGTSDSILGVNKFGVPTARVSDGEFVVNAKSTRENIGLLHALNSGMKLPGYFLGGVVGGIADAGSWAWDKAGDAASWVGEKVGDLVAKGGRYAVEHLVKPLIDAAKSLVPNGDTIIPNMMRGGLDFIYQGLLGKGDQHDKEIANLAGGVGFGRYPATPNGVGGLGPAALRARQYVVDHFGISNIGGYANRNIAGTNSVSDHATGHAIDVMIANYRNSAGIGKGNQVASYFVNNPSEFGTKYVIWRKQINQGSGWKAYTHPGGGSNDTLDHMDHVHVSLRDRGGMLESGTMAMNMSGSAERVLSPRQTLAFDRLVHVLDRDGIPSMASMEAAIFRASAKANAAAAIGQQTVIHHQGDNNITVHFHGDLSFPNITDGDDADVFLQNLGDLAGGGRR